MARLQLIFDADTQDIPDRAVPGLQKQAFAYNAQTGKDLTLHQFLALHLREMAIADDLNAALPDLQAEAQAEVQRRLDLTRDQLIADQETIPG